MKIIYARQPFDIVGLSVFLAGPTPRFSKDGQEVASWRPDAIKVFESLGFNGTLLVPEDESGVFSENDYYDQINWEDAGLNKADCIMFWIPRNLKTLPGLTTNDEWGFWKKSDKVVLGVPANAEKCKYQVYYAKKYNVPFSENLNDTVVSAIKVASSLKMRSFCHIWRMICA